MSDNIEGFERRRLARGVKICLDVLFYLLVALGVMWAAALAISSFTDYDEGWEVRVPVAIGEVVDTPLIRPFFTLLPVETAPSASTDFVNVRIWEARGKLRFLHHSLPLHLGNSAAFFLFLGVSLWAIALLRRILATTAGGRPFDPLNPRRLNTLGWIVLSTSVLSSVLEYLASRWILSTVEVTTPPLSPSIQVHREWILCGLLVLILAAIWKDAVRIAEEQALTV